MQIFSCRLRKTLILAFLLILCLPLQFFAQEIDADSVNASLGEEKILPLLKKQARIYRAEGLKLQRLGNIDAAMSMYQKAVELDPSYAVVYNDLGVMYEIKGFTERARQSYLKAIKTDPNYLSPYSNLALSYENERDLETAAYYWGKRIELASQGDPWRQKAEQRLRDLNLVLSETPIQFIREQDIISLTEEVKTKKYLLKRDEQVLSEILFEKAKLNFDSGDYASAMKFALDAQYLDPANQEIKEFTEKTQTRALSK